MDNKRVLCYMFVFKEDPELIRVIKAGSKYLSDYMQANNWKCLGSLEVTDEQFEAFNTSGGGACL